MDLLLKLLALWGVADSLFLAVRPERWSRFWKSWLTAIGEKRSLARLVAAIELGLSLYLLFRPAGRPGPE